MYTFSSLNKHFPELAVIVTYNTDTIILMY